MISPDQIRQAIEHNRAVPEDLFNQIKVSIEGKLGIFRDTYGPGENTGHEAVAQYAERAGLEVTTDSAANTYMTLPGRDRSAPRILIGSHLDSVPGGGNFDGAAGVIAGLTVLTALQSLDFQPACDITVMGIRAEESVWFQVSYIGSRAALGTLPTGALEARRIDTARTLADHLRDCGGDPDAVRAGRAVLSRENVRAFIELHIEQAPTLVYRKHPLAVGAGIPGNFRYPEARVIGRYDHVGTPREFRRDAAMAASELAVFLDERWAQLECSGIPMAVTFGRFHTDTAIHGLTTVPGEFHFSLDVRAYDANLLKELESDMLAAAERIERSRQVTFEFGARATAPVGPMCQQISEDLTRGAAALGIEASSLYSPASHDAAAFSAAGIPVGMIFIRNENGSHNPDEAMDIDDFLEGTRVLTWWIANCVK